MTLAMLAMQRLLPRWQQYALPPEKITEQITRRVKPDKPANKQERRALSLLFHFGYGAGAGVLYGLLAKRLPLPSLLKGPLYALLLWAGSYLGWLPLMGISQSAPSQPLRRNLLMIVAHLLWGPDPRPARRCLHGPLLAWRRSEIAFAHGAMPASEAIGLIEGDRLVGRQQIEAHAGIERVTEIEQRTRDAPSSVRGRDQQLANVHRDLAIGQRAQEADYLVMLQRHQPRPGVAPGRERLLRSRARSGPALNRGEPRDRRPILLAPGTNRHASRKRHPGQGLLKLPLLRLVIPRNLRHRYPSSASLTV